MVLRRLLTVSDREGVRIGPAAAGHVVVCWF